MVVRLVKNVVFHSYLFFNSGFNCRFKLNLRMLPSCSLLQKISSTSSRLVAILQLSLHSFWQSGQMLQLQRETFKHCFHEPHCQLSFQSCPQVQLKIPISRKSTKYQVANTGQPILSGDVVSVGIYHSWYDVI